MYLYITSVKFSDREMTATSQGQANKVFLQDPTMTYRFFLQKKEKTKNAREYKYTASQIRLEVCKIKVR
jgi:hypothetical protein